MMKTISCARDKKGITSVCFALLLGWATVCARGQNGYYPYEPVYVTASTQASDEIGRSAMMCMIRDPQGKVWTNWLTIANIAGYQYVPNGSETNMLFVVNYNAETRSNVFGIVGEYCVCLAGSTSTVNIIAATNGEEQLVGTVAGDMLLRIAMLSNVHDLDEGIKIRAQQVLQASKNGRYSEYARAYLAVDNFYHVIYPNPDTVGQFRPDFSFVHTNLASVEVSRPVLKQMVLFHLGYAEGLAGVSGATNRLTSLLSELPGCPWSSMATKMLSELTRRAQ